MSIRLRLTLVFAASAVSVLAVLAILVLVVERSVLERSARQSLEGDLAVVSAEIAREPDDMAQPGLAGLAEAYAVWRGDELLYASPGWLHFGLPTAPGEPGLRRVYERTIRTFYTNARAGDETLTVAVAHDETTAAQAVALLGLLLVGSVPAAVLATIWVGWFAAGRVLEPTRQLRRDLERITADRLDERIDVGKPGDEFGKLSSVLNKTLARLHEAMVVQRRFAADASHQLRTPLTAQRAIGEAALSRHAGDAEALGGAIAEMLEEADRLATLTGGLLELARTEQAALRRQPADLALLTEEAVERVRPLFEATGHGLTLSGESVTVHVNRDAFVRALTGILENTIVHCPTPCSVEVVTTRSDNLGIVEVRDDGPGIGQDEADAIFEPFHRGAGAESRPGSGLGLALARAAARSAGGQLTLASNLPTVFRFSFPEERTDS